jgi:hypothetical protein
MATKPFHYFRKTNLETQDWPTDVNSGVTIDAEIFVYFDTTAGYILPLNNDVNGANFVGQANDQNPINTYGSGWQQGGGSTPPNVQTGTMQINRCGQTYAKATASENYSAGTRVCIGADAQTISTSGSNFIGYVSGDQPTVTSATAGQLIKIDFRAQYPNVKLS